MNKSQKFFGLFAVIIYTSLGLLTYYWFKPYVPRRVSIEEYNEEMKKNKHRDGDEVQIDASNIHRFINPTIFKISIILITLYFLYNTFSK